VSDLRRIGAINRHFSSAPTVARLFKSAFLAAHFLHFSVMNAFDPEASGRDLFASGCEGPQLPACMGSGKPYHYLVGFLEAQIRGLGFTNGIFTASKENFGKFKDSYHANLPEYAAAHWGGIQLVRRSAVNAANQKRVRVRADQITKPEYDELFARIAVLEAANERLEASKRKLEASIIKLKGEPLEVGYGFELDSFLSTPLDSDNQPPAKKAKVDA